MANLALLVNLSDNTHADPGKEARGCWKRGHVVCIKDVSDVSWAPGSEERAPRFVWLVLWNVALSKAKRFLGAIYDTADGLPDGTAPRIGRSLYRLLFDGIPAAVRDLALSVRDVPGKEGVQTSYLIVGGPFADVTWLQARPFIENLADGLTEEERGTTAADLT